MAEEIEVSIPTAGINLQGTLLLPKGEGPFPALLYVSGSGPLDRDDNIPGQLLNNSKVICERLAETGIASLRYDKRGVGKSGGEFLSTGHQELVADACSAVNFLGESASIVADKIYVAGHSEGSIIAPQVSLASEQVAGLILLSPFVGKMEDILMMQAHALQDMIQSQRGMKSWLPRIFTTLINQVRLQKRLIGRVKRSNKDVLRFGFQKLPAKWFRELFQLDPRAIFQQVNVPTLLIGGAKDFQCDPADVAKIEALIDHRVDAHVIENMSHLLREEPAEPSIFNYERQLEQDIMPVVLQLILQWLQKEVPDHVQKY